MVGLQPSCLEGVTPVVAQHSNAASWPRMIGIMRYRLNTTCSAAFQCCVLTPHDWHHSLQTEHTCSAAFQCCVLAPRMIGIMRYRLNTTCSAAFQCCVLAPRMIGIMRYVVRTCRDNEDLDPNLRWDDGTPTHSI